MSTSSCIERSPARRRGAVGLVRAAAALALVACAGCGAPPLVHLHSLLPADRPQPREGAPAPGQGPAFVLDSLKVPAQVDQPQWLVRMPDGSLALLEQDRWASPLPDEMREALLEILRLRFGAVETRTVAPNTPLWRLRIDVTRFDSAPGMASLEATWTVTPRAPETSALRCSAYFTERAEGGMSALAEAHRRNVARLGDAIGEELLALQRGERARCPS